MYTSMDLYMGVVDDFPTKNMVLCNFDVFPDSDDLFNAMVIQLSKCLTCPMC